MLKTKIREYVLSGKSDEIRMLLMSQQRLKLIRKIIKGKITTAEELANAEGISIQNASMKMHRFFVQGYLNRYSTDSASGGIEFIYSVPENIDIKI